MRDISPSELSLAKEVLSITDAQSAPFDSEVNYATGILDPAMMMAQAAVRREHGMSENFDHYEVPQEVVPTLVQPLSFNEYTSTHNDGYPGFVDHCTAYRIQQQRIMKAAERAKESDV